MSAHTHFLALALDKVRRGFGDANLTRHEHFQFIHTYSTVMYKLCLLSACVCVCACACVRVCVCVCVCVEHLFTKVLFSLIFAGGMAVTS